MKVTRMIEKVNKHVGQKSAQSNAADAQLHVPVAREVLGMRKLRRLLVVHRPRQGRFGLLPRGLERIYWDQGGTQPRAWEEARERDLDWLHQRREALSLAHVNAKETYFIATASS